MDGAELGSVIALRETLMILIGGLRKLGTKCLHDKVLYEGGTH